MSADLSIILPAYLEEENLRILLPRITSEVRNLTKNYEIIVVDTESPLDGTQEVCKENNVIYINRLGGDFYGDAIRTGILHSRGKYIIFMDADGSHRPEFIHNLYNERQNYDIVIASRYVPGGHTENLKTLILMSKIVNLGYSLVLNIDCKDVSNSFKLYNGNILRSLDLKCKNFDIVEEILYKFIRKKKDTKILEIPFSFKKRMFGETKRNLLAFIFSYFFTLIKLRIMS